ncbi:DUF533 domain-containing protein [Falsiroseomonas oryzae]|uniref:DUF533 domain-containing protein n=1 Tax=Falsiroseomonas oryzae TaxID=2766473 RepID=UPI0022EACBC8|nr:DUF533 domain-containing protein [Roseomonas sp. MO-31]
MAATFLDRLLGRMPEPPAPQGQADDVSAVPPPARALHAALAAKVLHGWAENRHQVVVPLSVNLRRMPAEDRDLVVRAMVAARLACGPAAAPDPAVLSAALDRVGAEAADHDVARGALARPPDLLDLLAALETAKLGAHAFAAASLLLDRRIAVERAVLDWLAARFALPDPLVAGLARRYRR